jgi:hypothetical protein
MSRLFAGPWVGEFGWELMMWIGHLRACAKNYKEVIIASRSGHQYLYEDFMTQFIPYDISGNTDCELCDNKTYNDFFTKQLAQEDNYFKVKRFPTWEKPMGEMFFNSQKFIKYGIKNDRDDNYDIVIHVRNTLKRGSGYRNWHLDNWMELIPKLEGFRIASCGTKNAAAHIVGTVDKRGIVLSELCNMMANAKLVIGPSSGPMHLASLCGTPHVVTSHKCNIERYEKYWNPFHTKAIVVDDNNWNPSVDRVFSAIKELIC